MEEEIWKEVKDYHNYQVSNLGRVKSLKFGKERIMNPIISSHGYNTVFLSERRNRKKVKVHKLVAIAFLGYIPINHNPCGYELVVTHKNFDKLDDRVSNLEIVTFRESCNKKNIYSSSKYTGVSWDKNKNKWSSSIFFNKTSYHLGLFTDEGKAYLAYEKALKEINEGTFNRTIRINSSKYKGVSWYNRSKKWKASILINKTQKSIGYFKTELEAHEAVENYKQLLTLN